MNVHLTSESPSTSSSSSLCCSLCSPYPSLLALPLNPAEKVVMHHWAIAQPNPIRIQNYKKLTEDHVYLNLCQLQPLLWSGRVVCEWGSALCWLVRHFAFPRRRGWLMGRRLEHWEASSGSSNALKWCERIFVGWKWNPIQLEFELERTFEMKSNSID